MQMYIMIMVRFVMHYYKKIIQVKFIIYRQINYKILYNIEEYT